MWRQILLAICTTLMVASQSSYVESAEIATPEPGAARFEPQVALLCPTDGGAQFHPQYMTTAGRWVSDVSSKTACVKDKLDILELCKKVYPKRDITNIVESSRLQKVANWCKVGHKKCKGQHTERVKPYRCLEGPFQSDALLVPESCLFDHIHNESRCWPLELWNGTAAQSCRERGHSLRSFAMLLPCGISLFSGVEFVCCPQHFKDTEKAGKRPVDLAALKGASKDPPELLGGDVSAADEEDDEEDIQQDEGDEEADDGAGAGATDDDEYDDEEDEETSDSLASTSSSMGGPSSPGPSVAPPSASTPTPASPGQPQQQQQPQVPTPDPYFTHFDPRMEHQAYKEAQQRLEEAHREKVTKVMKDWSDLEERYQDMRASDPKAADEFKKRMTVRFQKTVQSLEDEGNAEKHQLVAMHQQRVMAHINERKKEAMGCYTQALSDNPPNSHRVQKCLQKLLRALHKDRHHTIAHYRHLLASSLEQAEREKGLTLEHLTDIDKLVNQSLQMLDRFPDLRTKIGQLMEDYIQALRSKDETPGSLLAMTRDAEAAILDKYRDDFAAKQEEKERQRELEKQRKEQRKKERWELRSEASAAATPAGGYDSETMEDGDHSEMNAIEGPNGVDSVAKLQNEDQPRVAHAQAHDVSHGEPTFSVRREVYRRESKSVYFTLAFAGIALMAAVLIGVAVLRRRHNRSPHQQGFVEVDQAVTPEERHVANMQINGYENPTYKYFEVKE